MAGRVIPVGRVAHVLQQCRDLLDVGPQIGGHRLELAQSRLDLRKSLRGRSGDRRQTIERRGQLRRGDAQLAHQPVTFARDRAQQPDRRAEVVQCLRGVRDHRRRAARDPPQQRSGRPDLLQGGRQLRQPAAHVLVLPRDAGEGRAQVHRQRPDRGAALADRAHHAAELVDQARDLPALERQRGRHRRRGLDRPDPVLYDAVELLPAAAQSLAEAPQSTPGVRARVAAQGVEDVVDVDVAVGLTRRQQALVGHGLLRAAREQLDVVLADDRAQPDPVARVGGQRRVVVVEPQLEQGAIAGALHLVDPADDDAGDHHVGAGAQRRRRRDRDPHSVVTAERLLARRREHQGEPAGRHGDGQHHDQHLCAARHDDHRRPSGPGPRSPPLPGALPTGAPGAQLGSARTFGSLAIVVSSTPTAKSPRSDGPCAS